MQVKVRGYGLIDNVILKSIQKELGYCFGMKDRGEDCGLGFWAFNYLSAEYYTDDREALLRLTKIKEQEKMQTEALELLELIRLADKHGYDLVKKPKKEPWKFHKWDLNTDPEAIYDMKDGDIVKFETYYWMVSVNLYNSKVHLTVVDFFGNDVSPKQCGRNSESTYGSTHVRAACKKAVFYRQELFRMIISGNYYIG